MSRRSFTLVELLVVMAIISVLAGMLMPAVTAVQKRARAMSCRSNLAQISKAVQLYTINYGGYLPGCADSTGRQFFGRYSGPGAPVDFSDGYLSMYVGKSRQVWQCPSWSEFMPRADGACTGYGYNYAYLTELKEKGNWWDPDYQYSWQGLPASIIRKHTRTILFADSARNWMGPLEENWFLTPTSDSVAWPGWETFYAHFRHSGQCNVAWADGHVSALEPDDFWPLDEDNLGVLCDTSDVYFDPLK